MDNKNINITDLVKKYEQMRYMNKRIYFDGDEFAMIAKYYIKSKNTVEAERVVNIGLDMHPDSSELMILKAKVLVTSEKYEIAYNYLSTMAEDETNVDMLLLKFECLIKLHRTSEAKPYLKYILDGELSGADYYTFVKELGYLYNDAEDFDISTMLLERALEVDDTSTDVLIELAYAYEMNDNMDKAIEITNAMIDLDPYSFDAWVSLGRLQMYNFEYELSIEAYDFALAIKESDVNVLKLKAVTYNESFDLEQELKVLDECLDASPDDESLYEELLQKYKAFEEYWGLEQDEGILKVLERKEKKFGPKGLLVEMAYHTLRLNKIAEAQEIYARIPDDEKNTADYYKLQADFAIQNDDHEAAERAYIKALEIEPEDVEVLDSLSEINLELERYEKSGEYLERLIAVDPEYSIAMFRLAFIRFEIGERESFNEIINQISDKQQLIVLLSMFSTPRSKERIDYKQYSRDELLTLLDEAFKNKVQLKKE